jgi:hypothetical protein
MNESLEITDDDEGYWDHEDRSNPSCQCVAVRVSRKQRVETGQASACQPSKGFNRSNVDSNGKNDLSDALPDDQRRTQTRRTCG